MKIIDWALKKIMKRQWRKYRTRVIWGVRLALATVLVVAALSIRQSIFNSGVASCEARHIQAAQETQEVLINLEEEQDEIRNMRPSFAAVANGMRKDDF